MTTDSDRLFDALAPHYEDHFAVVHRRAYDQLAWELTLAHLPTGDGDPVTVLDVGCGTGRWARALLERGHRVIGIEPAPAMAARARAEVPGLTLLAEPVETTRLAECSVDVALAMGSLQYSTDPRAAFVRVRRWLKPGGIFCLLVDSRVALGLELERADRSEEAVRRLDSRTGRWTVGEVSANLHLFDRESLEDALVGAGLESVTVCGLLVGASVWGREELNRRLVSSWPAQLDRERALAARVEWADLGKQLFAVARRPTR